MHACQFASVSPSMPAMRSMLICGKPIARAYCERAADLGRAMRAAVQLEDAIVEVLDAEAEPRDAGAADDVELGLGQRARLALERDLLGRASRARSAVRRLDQRLELRRRQEGRRAAAEVDEIDRPARRARAAARSSCPFPHERVEILLDLLRVLVRVDAEVAEMAALPAERDVQVQAERHAPRAAGPRAPGGASRSIGLAASRPKTAGSWRRSSCRLPVRPGWWCAGRSFVPLI